MPLTSNKISSLWLGGQYVAEEGQWLWTSAGNQSLAKDLLWYPGKLLFKLKGIFHNQIHVREVLLIIRKY